ncbi:hydroxycarboxylic acid receptor 2 [Centroberyx affinis]|uniref:hydroxycarboxylic acid receptor 2 n=1 Tax=Centroberyx affinis TaxID=166261 RepID=UPI003A5C3408
MASGVPEVMNQTNTMYCQATQNLVASVLPPVLIIEMIVGLPTNIVALWIFCFHLKTWKTHTLFLFNLVLADFLLLISVPFRIDNLLREEYWVFGGAWCRINLFMLAVNRSGSIAFMTAVAVDRYFKVVHPYHRINQLTMTQVGWVAGLIWTVVMALRVPLLAIDLLDKRSNNSLCRSFNSYKDPPPVIKLHYAVYIGEFFLPLLLLLFCSVRIFCVLRQRQMGRQKVVRRAIRTVGVIVAVFNICFLPGIVTGLGGMYVKNFRPKDCDSFRLITQLFSLSIGFTYLNSALDPVIYCFSSSIFHDALKSSISRLRGTEMKVRRHSSTANEGSRASE